MKKRSLYFALGFLFVIAVLALRPVPILPEEKCKVVSGTLTRVFEGGEKDLVFILEGDKTRYYVNRGLETGLDMEYIRQRFVGKEITLKYPPHWTLLDPFGTIYHVSKVEGEGEVLFDETK